MEEEVTGGLVPLPLFPETAEVSRALSAASAHRYPPPLLLLLLPLPPKICMETRAPERANRGPDACRRTTASVAPPVRSSPSESVDGSTMGAADHL